MTTKRMLISLAHPDDESFGWGAVIGKYVAEGVDIHYIVATKGDRGTIDREYLDKYGSIAATRDAEMDCAAAVLGFKSVIKFGYSDSGMMGTPDNEHPEALWQADEAEVTARIVEVMRLVKPHVVLTFDAFGGYGHPDHIYMHKATTRAFHAASDATQFPDAGEPYAPQKLYYGNISRLLIQLGIWQARLRLKNPRQFGVNKDIDMVNILDKIPPAHTRVHVGDYRHIQEKASACHASQGGGLRSFAPSWARRLLTQTQTFTLAHPTPPADKIFEHDLFEGVTA